MKLTEHLDPRATGLAPSSALALSERVDAQRSAGESVSKLTLGQSPFPVPERMVAALRDAAGAKEYAPVQGHEPLRKAIAAYVDRQLGIDRTADDVVIGPGSKELLFLLQLVFAGDLVVSTPAWGSSVAQATLLGRRVLSLHASAEDGFLLRPAALEAALATEPRRPRLLVLNYPSNPAGLTYRADELRELGQIAQRHELLVLSDEVYGELHHKGQHSSIARYYPEGTIVSTGLSKWVGAGGWRLGCLVFPDQLRPILSAIVAVASETLSATSIPIQRAAVIAFEGGEDIERYLFQVRRVLSALGRFTSRRLQSYGVRCAQPTGGFHVFADFGPALEGKASIDGSATLTARIASEARVALVPGVSFGRPREELTARLAYVDFDGPRALAAVGVIPKEQPVDETFLRRHCAPTVEAIERIGHWVQTQRR
ncbi:MAG: aminotransferase class I/II-fold pyridoxal phosphate-dependent enzyme [Deltaproteobacteria bacterium]|nr:aminotransferase class I/II-fold pyridoxal phosphate-dependent enzyme [Deltaproteobacteria bacterium]